MFETRRELTDREKDNRFQYDLLNAEYVVETRRTSEKDAQADVEILKFLGKKAWVVNTELHSESRRV